MHLSGMHASPFRNDHPTDPRLYCSRAIPRATHPRNPRTELFVASRGITNLEERTGAIRQIRK
jgi:hypothetical protein